MHVSCSGVSPLGSVVCLIKRISLLGICRDNNAKLLIPLQVVGRYFLDKGIRILPAALGHGEPIN